MSLKNGNVFTSKFVRTGPSSYEKRIYRAAVSQSLRNTELDETRLHTFLLFCTVNSKNAQLFHKLSHSYMFRHYRVILRELVTNTLPSYTSTSNAALGNTIYNLHKTYVKHLHYKLYYQQLHLKFLCNLARN